jgi:hypothetical protein
MTSIRSWGPQPQLASPATSVLINRKGSSVGRQANPKESAQPKELRLRDWFDPEVESDKGEHEAFDVLHKVVESAQAIGVFGILQNHHHQ